MNLPPLRARSTAARAAWSLEQAKISQRQAGRLIGMTAIMRDVIKFSEEMVALKQKLA